MNNEKNKDFNTLTLCYKKKSIAVYSRGDKKIISKIKNSEKEKKTVLSEFFSLLADVVSIQILYK